MLRRAATKLELEDYKGSISDYEEAQSLSPDDRNIQQGLRNAKLELKKSMRKDLYKLLGTNRSVVTDVTDVTVGTSTSCSAPTGLLSRM